ncbi:MULTISPECIES: hypothetical protein [Brevundimonas]|uniref:hypothetical protein n=1 Tax=Brevundimonas TaxID=41275 RepID=UPI000F0229D2|nr:hypothetical protein [Brevundimonas lutea]
MTDAQKTPLKPLPDTGVSLSNSSASVAIYEYDDVLVFLKPGAQMQAVFTGSEKPPTSTGTVPDWPKLTPKS